MKTCNRCHIPKEDLEFYIDRGVPRSICKDCTKNYRNNFYRNNRENCLIQVKKYQQTEGGRKNRRAWSKKRDATPEAAEYRKWWSKTEKGIASRKRRLKRFSQTAKGKASEKRRHARRRSNLENIVADLTAEQWTSILTKFNFCCKYCNKPFTKELPPTQDHVIPISKGGHHTMENVVPSCKSCNSRKKDKIYELNY